MMRRVTKLQKPRARSHSSCMEMGAGLESYFPSQMAHAAHLVLARGRNVGQLSISSEVVTVLHSSNNKVDFMNYLPLQE